MLRLGKHDTGNRCHSNFGMMVRFWRDGEFHTVTIFLLSPILVIAMLMIAGVITNTYDAHESDIATELYMTTVDDDCVSCPSNIESSNCSIPGGTVLGGLDVVQYFTDLSLGDGLYNESCVGSVGKDKFQYSYKNFTFLFLTKENLRIFETDPSYYVPQWGGNSKYNFKARCSTYR